MPQLVTATVHDTAVALRRAKERVVCAPLSVWHFVSICWAMAAASSQSAASRWYHAAV